MKKRPAYAKQLLLERRAGKHPLELVVVYGERWWDVDGTKICLKPEEYEPGRYDFTVAAGVKAVVLDQNAHFGGTPEELAKLCALVRELALVDAYVMLRWPQPLGWVDLCASEVAWGSRVALGNTRTWPAWWSDELEAQQQRRRLLHLQDLAIARGHFKRSDFGSA